MGETRVGGGRRGQRLLIRVLDGGFGTSSCRTSRHKAAASAVWLHLWTRVLLSCFQIKPAGLPDTFKAGLLNLHCPTFDQLGAATSVLWGGLETRMDSLTESEMAQIARAQREAGVQRLSRHFFWPEFCDERRRFHQEFVYDVTMFAAARGLTWPDVIRAAAVAKEIFPQLDGLDLPKLLSLLRDVLSERLPNLTSVHRRGLAQFLTDTLLARRKLLQAVVGGAANLSITQLHLEVQLPPTPRPLAQGTDLHEWEHRRRQAELSSKLQLKEEKLKELRGGSRVSLGEVDVPEDEQLDPEGVSALVRAAVRATEDQILQSLSRETSLLGDILQLKLQQQASATGGLQNPSNTGHVGSRADAPAKGKQHATKTKPGV